MKIDPNKIYTFCVSHGDSTEHYAIRGKNLSKEEKEYLRKEWVLKHKKRCNQ